MKKTKKITGTSTANWAMSWRHGERTINFCRSASWTRSFPESTHNFSDSHNRINELTKSKTTENWFSLASGGHNFMQSSLIKKIIKEEL